MKNRLILVLSSLALALSVGCTPAGQLKKTLESNPEILWGAIEKDPKGFFDAVKKAEDSFRADMEKNRAETEKKSLDEDFANPKTAEVPADRAVFGNKDAKITVIEYSDFLCPYCSRAANTMAKLADKYGDKMRLIYKHLPFKPGAEEAARYFEAIAMQDASKAKAFHDRLYANQEELYKKKEAFLDQVAKEVKADLAAIKKTWKSDTVTKRIEADMAEAQKFGFNGTPGFLVNGVAVRGAYPEEHFMMIIDRHLSETK